MFINRYTTPLHAWEYAKFSLGRIGKSFARGGHLVDVMFLFCNHFEGRALTLTRSEVDEWVERYPKVAARHRDADGCPPRHTWFSIYADNADNVAILKMLSTLCTLGYGEIELHLHHGSGYFEGKPARNMFPDVTTPEQLRALLRQALRDFNEAGALITGEDPPRVRYGVIHGAWALDNSRWMPGYHGWCGVNSELEILKETGCYADFTFPAWGTMQPAKINSIYYVRDDPGKPKSYNNGTDLRVGGPTQDALMIFEGPVFGGSDISRANPLFTRRVADWIRSGVHVKGRPNWVFVKVHTHGCQDRETMELLLGDQINRFFSHLETIYSDGQNYRLHYVTAREAYNIAKAAEAGRDGNPGEFRDFVIPAYRNGPSAFVTAAAAEQQRFPISQRDERR